VKFWKEQSREILQTSLRLGGKWDGDLLVKNKEPAFPGESHQLFVPSDLPQEWKDKISTQLWKTNGLSKRELGAFMIIQGMASRDTFDPGQATPEQRAKLAVIEVDALLYELNKPEENERP